MLLRTLFGLALLVGVISGYSGSENDIIATYLGVKVEKIAKVAIIEREILLSN